MYAMAAVKRLQARPKVWLEIGVDRDNYGLGLGSLRSTATRALARAPYAAAVRYRIEIWQAEAVYVMQALSRYVMHLN